ETDPRFDDYMNVMGTAFFAEAFASQEARDAALGPVNLYVEFVPASAAEVAAAQAPLCTMAIGPAFGEPGFEEVASPILSAIADFDAHAFSDRHGPLNVTIARTQYTILVDGRGEVSVSWHPLYATNSGAREEQT